MIPERLGYALAPFLAVVACVTIVVWAWAVSELLADLLRSWKERKRER